MGEGPVWELEPLLQQAASSRKPQVMECPSWAKPLLGDPHPHGAWSGGGGGHRGSRSPGGASWRSLAPADFKGQKPLGKWD